MLSLNDIKHKRFQKASFRDGYMREEVDDFLSEVESSYDALIQKTAEQHDELEHKQSEIRRLQDKIKELNAQIDQYRHEGDEIKEALVSAQKMRDAAVKEGREKADAAISSAEAKAKEIVDAAAEKIQYEDDKLQQMKQAVTDFRSMLLGLYKEHITLINDLPHYDRPKPETDEKAPEEQPKDAPAEEAEPEVEKPEEQPEPKKEQPEPVTFATTEGEPDYLTAKPFAPVKSDSQPKAPVAFGDEYDLDDDDATEIFSKRH
ncbi:MAG: DivIVA domain-containing protein [Oscillospiraceae bacterium]|jgi:cell division initiation protein|nr:DivIVA domain-containing protein [Oscillospiraceae bacterium]